MKWGLCVPRVHRNVLLEYLKVCLHFLYWPLLTCKHSQKYDDEEFQPYIHTHPSFNLSILPSALPIPPLNHARTNHSWSSLFNLQSRNICTYFFGTYTKYTHMYTVCIPLEKTGGGRLVRPRKGAKHLHPQPLLAPIGSWTGLKGWEMKRTIGSQVLRSKPKKRWREGNWKPQTKWMHETAA